MSTQETGPQRAYPPATTWTDPQVPPATTWTDPQIPPDTAWTDPQIPPSATWVAVPPPQPQAGAAASPQAGPVSPGPAGAPTGPVIWVTPQPVPPAASGKRAPAAGGWSKRRTIATFLGGFAVFAAAAGVTVAMSDSSSTATDTSAGAGPGGFGGQGGPAAGGAAGAGLMDALHGTVVVDDNGTYVTQAVQAGKVTAVSATSITVLSADGFSKTYVIGSSTVVDNGDDEVSGVATGHTVTVTATVTGDTATVVELRDQDLTGDQQGAAQPGQLPGGTAPTAGTS